MRVNLLAFVILLAASVVASGAERNPARHAPSGAGASIHRVIVKFRADDSAARLKIQPAAERTTALSRRLGMTFRATRQISSGLHVLHLEDRDGGGALQSTLARLRADPGVEFAEPDLRRYAHAVPNDPLFVNQWYLQSTQPAAMNAAGAWDVTGGDPDLVVAILDTGVRFNHPDLARQVNGGRLLNGRDFVSEDTPNVFRTANDGDGWDANAADPGDWIDGNDRSQPGFEDCDIDDSSWHGTRVAGIVGARTNNVTGIAGGTWAPLILPVRVLGKCGGYDSDIQAGLRWAAGIHIDGVPDNPTPAKVINLSLGASTPCSTAYRNLFEELTALGVLVVASAGNESGAPVCSPANCPGVLAVAGLRHAGSKVGFSNIGREVGISAPGGNCVNTGAGDPCLYSIDTTTDLGTTTPAGPGYTDQFNYNVGTSFSSPLAAVAAALVRSVNTRLTGAQTILRLQDTAAPFPRVEGVANCRVPTASTGDQLECNCTASTCGAGIVDAAAAVAAAALPFVIIDASDGEPKEGDTVTLDGSESFASDGRTVTAYAWTVVSPAADAPALTGADTATASFVAAQDGDVTVRLTVTDSEGDQDSRDVTIATADPPPPPPPPPPQPSSGGGGGALDLLLLMMAGALAFRAVASRFSAPIRAFAAARRRAGPARRAWRASGPRAPRA